MEKSKLKKVVLVGGGGRKGCDGKSRGGKSKADDKVLE